jgi:uncharacterized protein (DUF2235 family)
MPKNIVICCDGTGNSFGGDDNSNVVKLYRTLIINSEQRGYYHPGVGTMGDPRAQGPVAKQWSRIKGLAFGAGLIPNIQDAYRYLMDTYEDGDNVFLFGFSRGAYTARALAGVLHMYGLLCPGNNGLIPYITRMFAHHSRSANGFESTLHVAEEFKDTFSRECPVRFAGMWDTVSSVGWIYDPIRLPFTGRNPIIRTGRQAVSIHERRCFYRQILWGPPLSAEQDLRQVWFSGVHSDIGGSYPEAESQLSKVTLEWMLVEARDAGLIIDECKANMVLGRAHDDRTEITYVEPNPAGLIHKSLHGAWWVLEILPHEYFDYITRRTRWRIPMGARRKIPEHSVISSVARDVKFPTQYTEEPVRSYPRCRHGDRE